MKTKSSRIRKLSLPLPPPGPLEPVAVPLPATGHRRVGPGATTLPAVPPGVHGPEARPRPDARPGVAAHGAMVRLRARRPEFHKRGAAMPVPPAGAPRPRQIHGGLQPKRRAGK
jgi:hypothetical protein